MSILITGGAGYIGSCTTLQIIKKTSQNCIIIDKIESNNLKKLLCLYPKNIIFYKLDMCNYEELANVFERHKIDSVIHFAAYTIVSESEKNPHKYFYNNINSTLNLLELMTKYQVKKLIFSSSASVYGNSKYIPIDENHPLNPISPYAISKKISEEIISKYSEKGINFISLRYFNPAGAIDSFGEEHDPETHLIPLLIRSMIEGKIFRIFGKNFNTKDGTCIRDFIHIEDLVESHILALEKLNNQQVKNDYFNVGINKGYTVLEVVNKAIEIFKNQINPKFDYIFDDPRPGDTAILVAKSQKIKEKLNFNPKYDLEDILYSVWNYEMKKISI